MENLTENFAENLTEKSSENFFEFDFKTAIYDNFTARRNLRTLSELIVGATTISVIILMTIVGNILVILSIFTYRPLKRVQNFL